MQQAYARKRPTLASLARSALRDAMPSADAQLQPSAIETSEASTPSIGCLLQRVLGGTSSREKLRDRRQERTGRLKVNHVPYARNVQALNVGRPRLNGSGDILN